MIEPMRRESSTLVVLVGELGEGLLTELGRSGNVSVARVPAAAAGTGQPGTTETGSPGPAPARPGWEAGAAAMREAAGRQSTYVIVPEDPLAGVASAWRAMWDVTGGPATAAGFEESSAEALAAWRDKRFELPDYYLVLARPGGTGPDLYLGPLRAARQRRVALAVTGSGDTQATRVRAALRSLEHGPWWPPLDELIDVARRFYAGGLAETQAAVG